MRESDRLLERARKCFEDAAESSDPTQMKIHAEMGRQYLEQAAVAIAREQPAKNGGD